MRFHLSVSGLALVLVMGFLQSSPGFAHDTPPAPARTSGGGLLNPDVSLNGLFALSQFSRENPIVFKDGHDPRVNGFNLQQVELTLSSNVDPYFKADANIVLLDGGIEIEEAYATTLGLPLDLQIKAGQFFTGFGRHNPTHPHSWAWANKPLVLGRFFGGDGLRNPGAQLSWLSPLPWYSELTVSAQNATGETAASFNPALMRSMSDALYLARWANFFAITDALSLNLGASYLQGSNAVGGGIRTRIAGGDFYIKYRQPDALAFVTLQVEALQRYYGIADDESLRDSGWYAELSARLPGTLQRWHVGARYDRVGTKSAPVETVDAAPFARVDPDTSDRYRISPVVTYYPSEFSKVRLQYDYDRPSDLESAQHVGIVQMEFMIGAHGAHKF